MLVRKEWFTTDIGGLAALLADTGALDTRTKSRVPCHLSERPQA